MKYFDGETAKKAVYFIESYCTHTRGVLTGQKLSLMPWQKQLVQNIFGWKRADGSRQYRFVWLEAPRKSGKTTLSAAIILYMLLVDTEPSAEICIGSANAAQGCDILSVVRSMVESDPDMAAVCVIAGRTIYYKDNCIHVASSGESSGMGRNLSCAIIDDVQAHTSRHTHDYLVTGMAARKEPLVVYLSNAGWESSGLAWELHQYAKRIADAELTDPSWLVSIYGAEAADDWTDPNVWKKSHPGFNQTISEAFLRGESLRAMNSPGFVDAFRRLYLNIWTHRSARWLDMGMWDAAAIKFSREDYAHKRSYSGAITVSGFSLATDFTKEEYSAACLQEG